MLWPSTPTPTAYGESSRNLNMGIIMVPSNGAVAAPMSLEEYNARMNAASGIVDLGAGQQNGAPLEAHQLGQHILSAALGGIQEDSMGSCIPHVRVKNTFIDDFGDDDDDLDLSPAEIGTQSLPVHMLYRGASVANSRVSAQAATAAVLNQTVHSPPQLCQPAQTIYMQQPAGMMQQPSQVRFAGQQFQPQMMMAQPVMMQQQMPTISTPYAMPMAMAAAAPASPASVVTPYETRQPQPSAGSTTHGSGQCRPCAWFWKPQGCANGADCRHCHMCPEGELKNRKKDKVATMRSPPA